MEEIAAKLRQCRALFSVEKGRKSWGLFVSLSCGLVGFPPLSWTLDWQLRYYSWRFEDVTALKS